jgi:Flp pilus assembly protein TadB
MDVLAALAVCVAILSLSLALRPGSSGGSLRRFLSSRLDYQRHRLAAARVSASPSSYLAVSVLAPALLFAIGWLQSPVLAIAGGAGGIMVPRLYLGWLVHAQASRSEAEATLLLQGLLSGLTAGGTYLDALRQARLSTTDPWIREDLDFIIQRFLLDAPLSESLEEVRARTNTRNLGLIWETLARCAESHLPTQPARNLLLEISGSVQFNVQLANEVRARSAGQRIQIWLLALIVPGMYLYLRLMSPELLSMLDETAMGRYLMVPSAAALEVLGIVLSFRLVRVRA